VAREGSVVGDASPAPGRLDWAASLRGGGTHLNTAQPNSAALAVAAARKSYASAARAKSVTPPPSTRAGTPPGGAFTPTVYRPQSRDGERQDE
jgi:hypothetical protein